MAFFFFVEWALWVERWWWFKEIFCNDHLISSGRMILCVSWKLRPEVVGSVAFFCYSSPSMKCVWYTFLPSSVFLYKLGAAVVYFCKAVNKVRFPPLFCSSFEFWGGCLRRIKCSSTRTREDILGAVWEQCEMGMPEKTQRGGPGYASQTWGSKCERCLGFPSYWCSPQQLGWRQWRSVLRCLVHCKGSEAELGFQGTLNPLMMLVTLSVLRGMSLRATCCFILM